MLKPIFRWTCGGCTLQGMEILEESVFRAIKIYGENKFDWHILYNNLNFECLTYLNQIVQNRPIKLYKQDWKDCPIPDVHWTPVKVDGKIEVDGKKCGGTLWKVCPPRLNINNYEIVIDNDIVLLNKFPIIEEFLECEYKTLILEEPIRFYGRYNHLLENYDRLNSGIMGFPPGYDFGKKLRANWEQNGKYQYLTQADEQGLLMYTLNQNPNIRITKFEIREFLAKETPGITGKEYGLHFVQANRVNYGHRAWISYKEKLLEMVKFT